MHDYVNVPNSILFGNNKFYTFFEKFSRNDLSWLELLLVLQGGEGDCFYVVGSGEFEVLATQVLI